ncbi:MULTISPECIES: YybH family protein [unclassified Rhizobium]|uniref:YybH family protein n=1 Tax=unclassified Rhizobium TaxID=2613769 RepID=UPI001AD9E270|nr:MULTISPECIES: nuclear transport factor 2 family protein [unclassified Rhizobium]MBO9099930.1 nuclear transport factor 2 family protein [Rhizobium sp. L58/93]MBO9135858.1 nuclear transport factor 2 family protein [Rhizobium sp. B209b/85]MBO9169919.1 nuclear transport factor 2 family protein [Rhizobium sp. L245/93]MBO9185877.1 nuclear transport factor 2 family protein [Rhizobium sp. E27B/91]QXZ82744.1 nuclear transport factor 2 family protein [Rhizobium sp. K1/93]
MQPQELMKLYETKVNLRRFDEVAPLISADAVFWFTDGTHCGIDAIRAAFQETWRKLQNETYWLEDVDWIAVTDNAASCIYRFRWRAEIDGKIYEGDGRGTTILRKDYAQWKIVHEHLSRFPQ